MQAATIKLFLTDGKPGGIRTAEISNWSGKAIAGPRSELAELLKRDELTGSGVYMLTGVDLNSDQASLYIGEAESAVKRLRQHRERDDWNHVVVFVSKDENLTKAHARYLEGELISRAKQANRAKLLNNANSSSSLPESDRADMDVYLEKVLQLLPVLGVNSFKSVDRAAHTSSDTLLCEIKGLTARGERTPDGFVVYKGSQAVKEDRPSAARWGEKRKALLLKGVLLEKDGFLEFSDDYQFSSLALQAQ